ncbi:MAG TPA: hypothetical protein VFH73_29135 [Polyangia bacterium]|nr:hypothetical protein [Polyangia bacterium]
MSIATLTIVAAGASACTVGSGSGAAKGNLFVNGCGDNGENLAAGVFDLSPKFFAGEPIEDIARGGILTNRLVIRMQRNGNRIEVTDTLYFDVHSAYEVARCLRGKTNNGVPDWDTSGWCDWTGGAGGNVMAERPRIQIGHKLPVSSSLALLYTCNRARVVGVGVDGSWIDFLDFGKAAQPQFTNPDDRKTVPGDFKVDFGDRLQANFFVMLEDEHLVQAMEDMDPIPKANIGGMLGGAPETGRFDFDLERGRAAQPFP